MSKAKDKANLIQVKQGLARKCERLIKTVKSKPRKKTLLQQAEKFRRQASDLSH